MREHGVFKGWSIQSKIMISFFLVLLPVYFLGLSIFRWGYAQMHRQIIASQIARLNLYAETLDSELERIRNLQYDCINDEDILYLANAYDILDTFNRSQYILRAQHRLQVMKNSSMSISNVILHLPTVDKTIDTRSVEPLDPTWEQIAASFQAKTAGNLAFNEENTLQYNIPYPVFTREGQSPLLVMEIKLSNDQIRAILQGFGNSEEEGLVLTNADGSYILEKNDDPDYLDPVLLAFPDETPHTEDLILHGEHYQKTVVRLKNYPMALIAFASTEHLFGFSRTYSHLFILFSIVSVIVMAAFSFSIRYLVHKPVQTLVDAFQQIKDNRFDVRIHKKRSDEFAYLYESFNGVMSHLQQLIEQVYRQQLLTQRAELKQLQAQINPHFLYNGFYSIYRMARAAEQEDIAQFSQLLSQYYQYITRNAADEVPMAEEVRHAVTYLKIQELRFSNRLTVEVDDLPPSFDCLMVPRLIIQPLLENAFEHGLKNAMHPAIRLSFAAEGNRYTVCVQDNGGELDEAALARLRTKLDNVDPFAETTALANIHRRLRYRFGEQSGLAFSLSDEGGLIVKMIFVKGDNSHGEDSCC